jgi:hypothetical protein
MKKIKLISLLFLFFASTTYAQILSPEVISSQGGNFISPQFEVSYTVGEMAAISTISANNYILTQGFHQPDKYVTVSVDEVVSNVGLLAYPNPAHSVLNLQLTLDRNQKFVAECFDISGRLVNTPIQINHLPGVQTYQFEISGLAPGAYFLRLSAENGNASQTVKFTKHLN